MNKKVAIITGAYSGIGASLSRILAKNGYDLIISGKNIVKLEAFANELKHLTSVEIFKIDVRKAKQCRNLIDYALKIFGRIDLLVNNAGFWKASNLEDVVEKDIKKMYETNVFGPLYLAQAAVNIMKKQRSGHILNIGSTAAFDYKTSHIAYASSKSALIGMTGSLKKEVEGTGIRVSIFSPGGTKTNLFRKYPEKMKDDFMEADFVAEKIFQHIEHKNDDWNIILRRPSQITPK